MKPPKGKEIYHTPTSFWWMEDEIVCIVSKPNPAEDNDKDRELRTKQFTEMTGGKKVCILLDMTHSRTDTQDRAYREKAAKVLNSLVKTMAIIAPLPVNKMMVNVFFNMKTPDYTYRIFDDEKSAREWLASVCKKD
jgi:hypothetical protein